jgi:hypothetical protein
VAAATSNCFSTKGAMEPDWGTMVRSLCFTPAEASIEYSVYCVPVNQVATFLPAKSFTLVMPESL